MIYSQGQQLDNKPLLSELVAQHADLIYDLIYQVFGEQEVSLRVFHRVLKAAKSRYKRDRVERYAKVWFFRITAEKIQASYRYFLSEQEGAYIATLSPLSLEEKLCVLLKARGGLSLKEIAAILQISTTRAGRSLVYGHERLAENWGVANAQRELPLPERVRAHLENDASMEDLQKRLIALPVHSIQELGPEKTLDILSTIASAPKRSWYQLNWKSKLAIESVGFALVGTFVVVAMPWFLARVDAKALLQGRFADVIELERQQEEMVEPTITADRLLASSSAASFESSPAIPVADEFSELEFPSGDTNVEVGSAPIAPSRQSAAVYRLILQSPSPRDMIGDVNTVLANHQVRTRDLSGKPMPGGVFFDGITTQGTYPALLQSVKGLKQVGQVRTYGNSQANPNPADRARVIIWVQQI